MRELLAAGANPDPLWDTQARARVSAAHAALTAELLAEADPEIADALRDGLAMTDPSAQDDPPADMVPLFAAVAADSVEVVRALLAAGCDPFVREAHRRTVLFECNSEEIAHLLLDAGLSVHDVDTFGWTPLVANLDSIHRVRWLLALGSDPSFRFDHGYTVFMAAAGNSERSPEVMRALKSAGADIHAVSDLGYNAWHAAIDVNGIANERDSVRATFALLKEWGVDQEQRTNGGSTPLHRALELGTSIEVEELCAVGADVTATGPDGVTPLVDIAARVPVDTDAKVAALLAAGAGDPRD